MSAVFNWEQQFNRYETCKWGRIIYTINSGGIWHARAEFLWDDGVEDEQPFDDEDFDVLREKARAWIRQYYTDYYEEEEYDEDDDF